MHQVRTGNDLFIATELPPLTEPMPALPNARSSHGYWLSRGLEFAGSENMLTSDCPKRQ